MMARKAIADAWQIDVLIKSRRRCCVCFWLNGTDEIQKGQIAHLDKNNRNSAEENLVFLCMDHHDEYDGKTRQSKGLREKELRHWRDELYREMTYRFRLDVESEKLQRKFDYLEKLMPDLLCVMRRDLEKFPLFRHAVIRQDVLIKEAKILKIFTYGQEEVADLRQKITVLINQDLVERDDQYFRLTETLVTYLRTSSSVRNRRGEPSKTRRAK